MARVQELPGCVHQGFRGGDRIVGVLLRDARRECVGILAPVAVPPQAMKRRERVAELGLNDVAHDDVAAPARRPESLNRHEGHTRLARGVVGEIEASAGIARANEPRRLDVRDRLAQVPFGEAHIRERLARSRRARSSRRPDHGLAPTSLGLRCQRNLDKWSTSDFAKERVVGRRSPLRWRSDRDLDRAIQLVLDAVRGFVDVIPVGIADHQDVEVTRRRPPLARLSGRPRAEDVHLLDVRDARETPRRGAGEGRRLAGAAVRGARRRDRPRRP